MTRTFVLASFLVILAVGLLFIAGQLPRQNIFEVHGRVVGFGDDPRLAIIEHVEIPGFMPAMTMPFRAVEAAELEGLELGDAVRFKFFVTPDSTWIQEVARLPHDAIPVSPAAGSMPNRVVPDGVGILGPGETVPAFELIDQDGQVLQSDRYNGQALILSFIYTRCPIPTFCPLMSRNFQVLQPELEARFGPRAQLLSISFDTEHDTPDVLKSYARRYTQNQSNWTFATGTPEQMGRVTTYFGVFYESQEGEIDHNLATALIGPDGRLVRIWRGNEWEPQAVLAAVEEVL